MTYKPFDLSGKVCVVTGGNKGIGLGMVEALAASNADVVIWGRKADDNASAVESASKLGTGKVKAWVVDVGEEDQVVKAMKELRKNSSASIRASRMPASAVARWASRR